MKTIHYPLSIDLFGNIVDNKGDIVAKPVDGYEAEFAKYHQGSVHIRSGSNKN